MVDNTSLTDRQLREREYYEEYSRRNIVADVNFDPVAGKEKRPWNSYWFVYQLAVEEYARGKRTLLDYGCGSGASSVRFAKIGYDVKGFDISPNNISIARTLAAKYEVYEKIELSVQSAEHLDYAAGSFDIIIGTDILHHVEIQPAIKECYRLLKRDGVAIFREHVEVPIFDYLRETRIVTAFVPKEKSFEHHITEDERKLNTDDLKIISDVFPGMSIHRFLLLSRVDRFIRKPYSSTPSLLEKVDDFIFKRFPVLDRFGGEVVLVLHKQ
jgi:2-polyprenyl-3-methyl-5-hydroxy-6-metoxy-1,4-benzoquinol methylase